MVETKETENYAEILAQTEQRVFQIRQARMTILTRKYNRIVTNLIEYYEKKVAEMYRQVVKAIFDRKDTLLTRDTVLSGFIEVEITNDDPDAFVVLDIFRTKYCPVYLSVERRPTIAGLRLGYCEYSGYNKYKFMLEIDSGEELDESDLDKVREDKSNPVS